MMKIIDAHCHVSMIGQVSTMADADSLKKIVEQCGYEHACIQTITYYKDRNLNRNPLSLMLKAENPDFFYIFGGIRYPMPGDYEHCDFAGEAERLWQMGFDGLKLFAKPTVQGDFKLPLDAPPFRMVYEFCQEHDWPILFHVGDPATFWNRETVPDWAMANGWFYGDGDFPSYDEQYEQCERFLAAYPRLKIVFPHFYFMADNLERLSQLMRQHKNMMIDITPGSELYFHLSAYPDRARAFFLEFADRILYGTDTMGDGAHPKEAIAGRLETKSRICRFLETGDIFEWTSQEPALHGIQLPTSVLEKIYRMNFLGLVEAKPRRLNRKAVLQACRNWYDLAAGSPDQLEINLREFRCVMQRIDEALRDEPSPGK